ncbi:MAG: nucleoside monophosphate kinase [Parcubacteria group bacterium]|nr:nucleoside monophosphate kinase [Parcubacteria group bacterium]
MKRAVLIYGPPGAGKGTQADLLSKVKGFFHFDTGKFVESIVYDPARRNDPVIRRERKNFEIGRLMTPSWILKMVSGRTKKFAKAGMSIVFSGSPRTYYEAFDDRGPGLVEILSKLYGKKNVHTFIVKIPENVSIARNSSRLVCSVCRIPIIFPEKYHSAICHICGGKLRRRALDKPEVIKVRLKEYRERTEPIFRELRKRHYQITEIDGRPAPAKIFEAMLRKLK